MKCKIVFLLLIAIGLFQTMSVAQTGFDPDHSKFLRQFDSYLQYSGELRKDSKSIYKEFEAFWESDTLTVKEKDDFIATASKMREKGCQEYPEFVTYAINRMEFSRLSITEEQYKIYENEIIEFLKPRTIKRNDLAEFLLATYRLINQHIVYYKPKSQWRVSTDAFEFAKIGGDFCIKFNNTDLILNYGNDSVKISKTNGVLYPFKELWVGKNGLVTWERVKLSADSIYANLRNYKVSLKEVKYVADSVTFINSIYFKEPLLGQISDEALNLDDPSKSTFPRFRSYQQKFKIKNIVKGVDYEGGFSMRGDEFIGSGIDEKLAHIYIAKNDTISFSAYSKSFHLDPKQIFSEHTTIVLRMSEDSIYHPDVTFKFTIQDGFLELIRLKEGMSQVNFFDSYHQISMDFTWLKWYIDKFLMEITVIQTPGYPNEVLFESLDYYRYERYNEIKMRDAKNPLEYLTEYCYVCNCQEFTANQLAAFIKFSPTQVKQMLLRVAYMGFIIYDPEKEIVKMKPEAWAFIDAYKKTKDSDVLQFYSKTPSQITNAELSLLNYDLKIMGIPAVNLSDSQNVKIYPIDKTLILKKNRSFKFNGTIQAGQFYFYGSNFGYNYNRFMLDMPQCDSMKMVAETDELDSKGNKRPAIVRNKIENFYGEFFIDDPLNKSGRFDYPQYPSFINKTKSYVYYDAKDIYNGVYKRQKFYFEVDPFTIDSIKGYKRENLKFKGRLVSAGIFPDIAETLVLRDDFSLGFRMNTKAAGLPLYDGKAKYNNIIDLSYEGLRGKGKLEYLTSTFQADYLVFFPDSLQGHSETFKMDLQTTPVQFPVVFGADNTLNWQVKRDKFFVYEDSTDFQMYNNQAVHKGFLNITSNGLLGTGTLTIQKAKLSSKLFDFGYQTIDADTANFEIYAFSEFASDFDGKNVNSHVDFASRKGTFKTNGEQTKWEFKYNKYISIMDQMIWHMDKEELEISASSDVLDEIEKSKGKLSPTEWEGLFFDGPEFISVHPGQDSLRFTAPRAKYNYTEHVIYAEGVQLIRVADATVYLDAKNQVVVIEKDAKMQPINNVEIQSNVTTRFHSIYDANVNITGRLKYTGEGYYNYTDDINRKQKLFFNSVSVDYSGQTIASGRITEPDNFMLSPHFAFQGEVRLAASREHLEFIGAVKISPVCDTINTQWLKFASIIDPSDIYIPVDSLPLDINNQRISTGLHFSSGGKAYPAFISRTYTPYDIPIFESHGYLYYDKTDKAYMIASREKIDELKMPGNFMEYYREECKVYGEGKFDLTKRGELFNLNSIGNFEYDFSDDTIALNLSMLIYAPLTNQAWKRFAAVIQGTQGLEGVDMSSELYEKALVEFLGTKKADEWFSNLSLGNTNKYPDELENMLIITDLQMTLHYGMSSFIHAGQIGIVNAGKNQVSRSVFGFVKAERGKRSDTFEMLIEPDDKTWFYFRYVGGVLTILSSDQEFNDILINAKDNDRYFEDKETGGTLSYICGGDTYYKKFKRDMYKKFNLAVESDEGE